MFYKNPSHDFFIHFGRCPVNFAFSLIVQLLHIHITAMYMFFWKKYFNVPQILFKKHFALSSSEHAATKNKINVVFYL